MRNFLGPGFTESSLTKNAKHWFVMFWWFLESRFITKYLQTRSRTSKLIFGSPKSWGLPVRWPSAKMDFENDPKQNMFGEMQNPSFFVKKMLLCCCWIQETAAKRFSPMQTIFLKTYTCVYSPPIGKVKKTFTKIYTVLKFCKCLTFSSRIALKLHAIKALFQNAV